MLLFELNEPSVGDPIAEAQPAGDPSDWPSALVAELPQATIEIGV